MSVTVVTRWSTPDISVAMDILRRAKTIQIKHGAESFRANQVYTGEFTGQLIVAAEYADLAAWGRAQAGMVADMQPLFAETAKLGGVLQERVVLMGLDI